MIIGLKPADKILSKACRAIAEKLREKIKPPCEKILLIHPQQVSEQDFFLDTARRRRYSAYPPTGCGILARNIIERGYQPDILDLHLELLMATQKENFNYSFWKELLKKRLNSFQPDLVGISCMFSMTHDIMLDIIREIKQYKLDLPIICGGVHLTDSKHLVLCDSKSVDFLKPDDEKQEINSKKMTFSDGHGIDFIGLFECDKSFPDMIDFVNGKLPAEKLAQLATIIDGQYIALDTRTTPSDQEINAIPFFKDLPIDLYSDFGQVGAYGFLSKHRKASAVGTNRGCRAHCSFCTVPSLNGPGVRLRPNQTVLDEIKILYYDYRIRQISWLDDDFLNNPKRIKELLWAMADLKLDLTWDASNGLIAAAIKEDILDAMVASGCVGFNLGIETGNPQRLRDIHKPGTVKSFRDCKKLADKYPHLFIKGFLIIGFPDETLAQLLDTVNLGLELQLDWYSIQILNPLPSTEIYDSMVERGLIQDALNTNKSSYVFGTNGRQRITEERERMSAADFFDLFGASQPKKLLKPEQLKDFLFLMDYKMNYEVVFAITRPEKLKNKDTVYSDICERIAPESPLAQLFYGITRKKLGDNAEASKRALLVRKLVRESAYWKKRFNALNLYSLIEQID